MGKFTKAEKSWMMYDWANSAYSVIVTTAIFPIYYKAAAESAGVVPAYATAYLGYTISISTFMLAVLGPILGTIADFKGMKEKFFRFFFLDGGFINGRTLFRSAVGLDPFIGDIHDYGIGVPWSKRVL